MLVSTREVPPPYVGGYKYCRALGLRALPAKYQVSHRAGFCGLEVGDTVPTGLEKPAPRLISPHLPQQLIQRITITAAEGELCSALQNDSIIAMKHRLQFLNTIDVHHRRAADSQKF